MNLFFNFSLEQKDENITFTKKIENLNSYDKTILNKVEVSDH